MVEMRVCSGKVTKWVGVRSAFIFIGPDHLTQLEVDASARACSKQSVPFLITANYMGTHLF
ncbi:hypothetical protein AS888_04120 [Peribacillus simplex]|uniref:Uncharacterized protein n=1 Tax=Peribacillus simplex TaxID=1478 RepID=A0A120GQQ9_9BACI|nr:hypothetical protein AS888_04120 [Peribacillus simplex]